MPTMVEELTQLGAMQALKPPVHILDDYGHVDKGVVRISIGTNEQVEWKNDAEHDAQIVFEDSPFAPKRIFAVAAGKSTLSGIPTVTSGDKRYKYTVIGSRGNHDPVVIIDP